MAKSKSFFGLRSGSTKSLTFQVYRGEQITKDRVYRVSNPRTEAQMTQRALIPIVAAARSALKGLVDHSFEGVPYGEASLKEFSKQNLRAGALNVTSYSPNGVSNPGFAMIKVSDGSINIPFSIGGDKESTTISNNVDNTPDLSFPAAKANDSAGAIIKYLETYARTNNVALIAPGTQLSFLSIVQSGTVLVNTGSGEKTAPTSGFILNRIYIPDNDEDSENAMAINDKWHVTEDIEQGATSAAIANDYGDKIIFETNSPLSPKKNLRIKITPHGIDEGHPNCGMALILSRYENGVWKRNPAYLNIDTPPQPIYTFEDWLSRYQTTGAASKKYLNTGDESTGIQG